MIKDLITYSNDRKFLKSKCFSCDKPNHNLENCPLIDYQSRIDKPFVISKMNFSQPQVRKPFKRKNRYNKFQALENRKFLMKAAVLCRFNKNIMKIFQSSLEENQEKIINQDKNDNLTYKSSPLRKLSLDLKKSDHIDSLVNKKYKSMEEIELSSLKGRELDIPKEREIYLNEQNFKTLKEKKRKTAAFGIINLEEESHKENPENSKINVSLGEKRGLRQLFVDTKQFSLKKSLKSMKSTIEENSPTLSKNSNYTSKIQFQSAKLKEKTKNKELFWYNFEVLKEYQGYFHYNNASNIIKSLKPKRKQKTKRTRLLKE